MADIPLVRLSQLAGTRPVFATRFWGFEPETWGAVTFPHEATVDRWMKECPEGGFVLGFASHHPQPEVAPGDRGRVFGVYEFSAEKVAYNDPKVIDPKHLVVEHNFRDGQFRWPFGLRARRAWRFADKNLMTIHSLPDARREAFILTTSMAPLSARDFGYVDQYDLLEVPVYNVPFRPLRLGESNARPDGNYLLVCRDAALLARIPGWKPGEILYKPGIASDIDGRRENLNGHPVSKLFGLQLELEWQRGCSSEEEARRREAAMIAVGERTCRLAASGQREFFLGPESVRTEFLVAAGAVRRVE